MLFHHIILFQLNSETEITNIHLIFVVIHLSQSVQSLNISSFMLISLLFKFII